MFEKGDLVTYGCKGVCEVKNIITLARVVLSLKKLKF